MKNNDFIKALEARRSVRPTMFTGAGPTNDELERILTLAMRVPDHKKLAPWRFLVFQGEARNRFGEILASECAKEETETAPSQIRLESERTRFLRAPVVVAVISSIIEKPSVPEWEQILSAGAAGFALCLAANTSGFATSWLTEWIAYSEGVRKALGLGDNERVAGFIYIGQGSEVQDDRPRPTLAEKVSYWRPTP